MPQYRITAPTFIKGRVHEAGEVVEFDGRPNRAMERIEPEAKPKAEPKGRKSADLSADDMAG